MRKVIIFVVLIFAITTINIKAEDKMNLAVAELSCRGVSEGSASTITDFLRSEMVRTGKFNVVDRKNMQSILAEQKLQLTGITSQDAVKIGKILNVNYILLGTISELDFIYIVNVNMVDVETGKIIIAEKVKSNSLGGLTEECETLAKLLSRNSGNSMPNEDTSNYNDNGSACILSAEYGTFENDKEFNLFANSGWDGNWFVGYKTGWIVKIPPIPNSIKFSKAYIGAKLGRAKNGCNGKILIGINSKPEWDADNIYTLTNTNSIFIETKWERDTEDKEHALDVPGKAKWFWVEVPKEKISYLKSNYLSIWSSDRALDDASTSPILAGRWGNPSESAEINKWVDVEISGEPPTKRKKITVFEPAMAIKLVP